MFFLGAIFFQQGERGGDVAAGAGRWGESGGGGNLGNGLLHALGGVFNKLLFCLRVCFFRLPCLFEKLARGFAEFFLVQQASLGVFDLQLVQIRAQFFARGDDGDLDAGVVLQDVGGGLRDAAGGFFVGQDVETVGLFGREHAFGGVEGNE